MQPSKKAFWLTRKRVNESTPVAPITVRVTDLVSSPPLQADDGCKNCFDGNMDRHGSFGQCSDSCFSSQRMACFRDVQDLADPATWRTFLRKLSMRGTQVLQSWSKV